MIEGIRGNIYLMGQQKGELKKYRFVAKRAKPNPMNWIAVLQTIQLTLFVEKLLLKKVRAHGGI